MTQVETNLNIIAPSTQDIDIRPPSPPKPHPKGNFDYIKSENDREMIENAYRAVNQLELWDFMKKDCESYMMSNCQEIKRIGNKMIELGYDGHSGFSFGWTMRQIQYIAKHGEIKYMENWILNNRDY